MTFEEWWDKFALTEINGNLGFNARKIWEAAQEEFKKKLDDELTAAFMLGYEAAKNDYGRNKP